MLARRIAVQERDIFRGLHGDLCEEHHVRRQLRQALHQLESLRAQRPKLLQPRHIVLALRHREVGQGDRVEVVVGERHETEAAPSKLQNLLDDDIHATLSRRLAVGAPDRAERAMLRAAADGLDRAPHVAPLRQELPARGNEAVGIDPAGLVDPLQRTARRIVEHERPDDVAVPFDDGVCAAQIERLVGVQRGVDAAEDHDRPSGSREGANLVSAKGIAGVNADADDIAGSNRVDRKGLEGFVGDLRTPIRRRSRRREDEQPARRDHADAK